MKLYTKNIKFSYGNKEVLKGIDLNVKKGEVVSIVGPNGSGKSTLLKCIQGILKPKDGAVYVNDKETSTMALGDLAKTLGYVPQSSVEVFTQSVFETVLMGRKPHLTWGVRKKDLEIVEDILTYMGLEDISQCYLNELSGGQKQKALIARALAQEPEVILLDEPTNNLDIKHQLEVLQIIKSISEQRGSSFIMVIHDLNLAARFSDRLVLLNEGEIFSEGTAEEVLTEENIKKVYEVESIIQNTHIGRCILPVTPLKI